MAQEVARLLLSQLEQLPGGPGADGGEGPDLQAPGPDAGVEQSRATRSFVAGLFAVMLLCIYARIRHSVQHGDWQPSWALGAQPAHYVSQRPATPPRPPWLDRASSIGPPRSSPKRRPLWYKIPSLGPLNDPLTSRHARLRGDLLRPAQALVDQTWRQTKTRDRVGDVPVGLEVTHVLQFLNYKCMARYSEARSKVQARSTIGVITPPVATAVDDAAVFAEAAWRDNPLDPRIEEHYLFHGSSRAACARIGQDEFDLGLAGSHAGALFGPGVYLAESAAKADEYAEPGATGAMMLCRVVLGHSKLTYEGGNFANVVGSPGELQYDSLLGDRAAAVGTYREFVAYSSAAVWPQFVLMYKRVWPEPEAEKAVGLHIA